MIPRSRDDEHRISSKPLSKADAIAAERWLRDMAATMLVLIGRKPADVEFMFQVEPDGSRVAALLRLVNRLFALIAAGGDE